MDKIIKRISNSKNDKRSINGYVKCFISNEKSKELFKNSKTFAEVKNSIAIKKVS